MSAIIRDAFKINTLTNFINSLVSNSMYLGIGRPYYWGNGNDNTVPNPANTVKSQISDWEDIFALKRVAITDAIHGFFKELWEPNVRYDAYRHDWDGSRSSVYDGKNISSTAPQSVADAKCIVVTPAYNIYMCMKQAINVATQEVQPSLYDPDSGVAVGTNTTIVKTADGYYWKFLAVTSAADILKFSNKYYHPIETIGVEPAPSDPYYDQWVAQSNSATLKGGIYTINVLTKGTGYKFDGVTAGAGTRVVTDHEADAEFKVIGDGTGLQYTVTYGAGGTIEDVEITNPGTGFTHATVVPTTGIGASFDVVFTPTYGLGVQPIRDVSARYMITNVQLAGAEGSGDFTVSNDYRKICLIYNPTNFGSSTVSTASTMDASLTIQTQTNLLSTAYPVDSIITGASSGARARVIDWDDLTGTLRVIRTASENAGYTGANNDFQVSEAITPSTGTGGGTITSLVQPEVQRHSGDILYSEYRAPINRQAGQTESLTIVLKF